MGLEDADQIAAATGATIAGTGYAKAYSNAGGTDARWTFTGAWSNDFPTGRMYTLTQGDYATFSTVATGETGTVVEVEYQDYLTTPFTISVDGATAGAGFLTVTPTNTLLPKVATLTGLPNSTHSVKITNVNVAYLFLYAAAVRQTTGLIVDNYSINGAYTPNFAGSGALGVAARVYDPNPALVIVPLGVNDLNPAVGNLSQATVIANLTQMRNDYPNSDFLLVAEDQSTVFSDSAWDAYVAALYTLADTLDVPLLDMHDRWGRPATKSANGLMFDGTHQNVVGDADWGLAAAVTVVGTGSGAALAVAPISITTGTTAAPSAWYRGTASLTVTLPATPTDLRPITIDNSAANGSGVVVSYVRGGTDTIETLTAAQTLNPNDRVTLAYQPSSGQWMRQRRTTIATPGTTAGRDDFGRGQFGDPLAGPDAVTRQFADGKVLAALSATATSSATASTETILLRATVPANSPYLAAAGRPVKVRLGGYSTSTGTLTFRVRAGAAGTTADAVIWTSTTTVAQATNQRATIDVEMVMPTTTTLIAEGDGNAGTAAIGTAVAAPAAATIAPAAIWYIDVSVVCTVASGFIARTGSIIVQ